MYTEKLDSAVTVMKAAEDRLRSDVAEALDQAVERASLFRDR